MSAAPENGGMDREALAALGAEPLGWRAKGFPLRGGFATVDDVRAARPALLAGGFTTPIATLRSSALQHNLERMAEFCATSGVRLAPHGKTTMAPQLFEQQLRHGAWGISVATPWQARVCCAFGVPRVLLANEIVDPAALSWVAGELADPERVLLSYVDDPVQVRCNDEVLHAHGAQRPLDVLVELGYPGGRTGCRTPAAVDAVVRAIEVSEHHRLVGVAGYEGLLGHAATPQVLTAVRSFLADLRATAERLEVAGAFAGDTVILSAGGSAFFDVVVEELSGALPTGRAVELILRSGGYVSHDDGLYADVSPFTRRGDLPVSGASLEAAVQVWSRVLSRPEPELALLDVGKRDVPVDAGMPVVNRVLGAAGPHDAVAGWRVVDTNDQHGYLALPAEAPLAPGDLVALGVSHPCTLFDKWRWIPVVDEQGLVIDVVRTFF